VKGDDEGVDKSDLKLEGFECLDALTRRLDLCQQVRWRERNNMKGQTLIASVRIAATTSSEPLSIWLLGREGSYSQMAVVVSTAAIFVMRSITATFARLMTWPRHLQCGQYTDKTTDEKTYGNCFSSAHQWGSFRCRCISSTVVQSAVLLDALSSVAVSSCPLLRKPLLVEGVCSCTFD